MKTYKTQAEVEADIKDGWLRVNDDVTFECNISIQASIDAWNINAWSIDAWNIDAVDINAWNINAWNIDTWNNINAVDIKARDIDAWNIDAVDINAWNINAWNIDAVDIRYYAVCFAYQSITCKSISARRENGRHFVLDGEIKIEKEK